MASKWGVKVRAKPKIMRRRSSSVIRPILPHLCLPENAISLLARDAESFGDLRHGDAQSAPFEDLGETLGAQPLSLGGVLNKLI